MHSTRLIVLTGLLAAGAIGYTPSAQAMTEDELCRLYMQVVESAVDVFEPLWTDDSKRVPNSGFFDFRKYTDWEPKWYAEVITVPGSGQVIYCYTLLLSETQKETFGAAKLSRATLLDRCIKVLRWISMTSAYVEKPYDYLPPRDPHDFYQGKNWRRKLGYRADEMGWITLAAARIWDKIDPETKKLLEAVMIGGAPKQRLPYTWDPGQGGNHDQVKQDLASTIGAAYLFPQRPDHALYQDIVRWQGIDIVSTWHDRACAVVADGKPVKEYAKGWNLYQDYSSDHHGWAQVWYGNDKLMEGRLYLEIMSDVTKLPIPETFRYPGNGYDGILEWIKSVCLPEGDPVSVHGMEYDAYYGSGLLCFCYGAVLKKDPVAAALEERTARLLKRHIETVREYDYHRNSFAKCATAYLIHKLRGPRAEPLPIAEAVQRLESTYHYRWHQDLVHRDQNKIASFSWGSITGGRLTRMSGYVVPTRGYAENIEPLVYQYPGSMIGGKTVKWEGPAPKGPAADVVYRFARDEGGLSTAGVVNEPGLDRYYAFFSFDNGPCAFFTVFRPLQDCRISFNGIPLNFYARKGITESRTYYDAQGPQPLEQAGVRNSSWWCVNDVLGVAAVGGTAQVKLDRQVGFNWARIPAYRDKSDTVWTSVIPEQKVEAGQTAVDIGLAIYPDTPHDQVAKASSALGRSALHLPESWKGLVVPDAQTPGKRYLAIANLSRQESGSAVELTFDEGAPILTHETMITGKSAMALISLDGLDSSTETLELYAETTGNTRLRALRPAFNRYLLDPVGEQKVSVRLQYRGVGAESFAVTKLDGTMIKSISPDALDQNKGFALDLTEPIFIEIRGKAYIDSVAPAVEINDVSVREDGRVTIEVASDDRSGIESVELLRNGTSVGKLTEEPYLWLDRPGNGAYTYTAVAIDDSPKKNKRTSMKRTVVVEVGKPSP